MVVVDGLVEPNDFLDAFEQNVKDGVNYTTPPSTSPTEPTSLSPSTIIIN
jgi:hypothetical protein